MKPLSQNIIGNMKQIVGPKSFSEVSSYVIGPFPTYDMFALKLRIWGRHTSTANLRMRNNDITTNKYIQLTGAGAGWSYSTNQSAITIAEVSSSTGTSMVVFGWIFINGRDYLNACTTLLMANAYKTLLFRGGCDTTCNLEKITLLASAGTILGTVNLYASNYP